MILPDATEAANSTEDYGRITVFLALDTAVSNGYTEFVLTSPLEVVVDDLRNCDYECSLLEAADVKMHLEAWRKDRGAK